jgi:hypothetical protein
MGNGRALFIIALTAVAVASGIISGPASAQDDYWSVSAANWMQYWHDRDTKEDSLDNRFIVDFNLGDFYAGTWIRIFEPMRPDTSFERITQRYFGWNNGGLTVHLGNFYQVFGRGLTLNAFQDDALSYNDNNLDGVKLSGLYEYFEFDAFSGRGLYFRPTTGFSASEREYILRGIRGNISPGIPGNLGFSYVRFKQDDFWNFDRAANINLTSFFSEFNYGPVEIYGEYAYSRGFDPQRMVIRGDATYANMSISQGVINVLGEYKNYINILYPDPAGAFNNPPPASHQGRTLSSLEGAPGERGYQLSALIAPSFDLNFDFSFSESFHRGFLPRGPSGELLVTKPYLAEKFAGARWQVFQDLIFNYHWDRFDYTREDEIENYLDGYYYLDPSNTISFTAYTRRFIDPFSEDYHEDYVTLGYSRGNVFQLNIGGSTTTKTFRGDPEKLAFVELVVRYKEHELMIFNGGERGGLLCSSGICQIRPTFEGTRVILFSRF